MNTKLKSFFLFALIVACLGYFYSKDRKTEDRPDSKRLIAPALQQHQTQQEVLPKKDEAALDGSSEEKTEKPSRTGASVEATISEEERLRIQAEIKGNLASMYVAQKAFHAEFGRYTTDLKAIGWDPRAGEVNVKIGFAEPAMGVSDLVDDESLESRLDSDYFTQLTTDPLSGEKVSYKYSKFGEDISLKNLSQYCRRGCSATSDRFEIMAVSKIGPNGEPDVWLIDDDKNIIHVTE